MQKKGQVHGRQREEPSQVRSKLVEIWRYGDMEIPILCLEREVDGCGGIMAILRIMSLSRPRLGQGWHELVEVQRSWSQIMDMECRHQNHPKSVEGAGALVGSTTAEKVWVKGFTFVHIRGFDRRSKRASMLGARHNPARCSDRARGKGRGDPNAHWTAIPG